MMPIIFWTIEAARTIQGTNMTYEELRQRCLNHAGMHPSNPSDLTIIYVAAEHRGIGALTEMAGEMARYIEKQRKGGMAR